MIRWAKRKAPPEVVGDGVIQATARVDARTKNILTRIQQGEIAVIDHEDIDRIAAEGLIQRQAGAVVNAARSSSGRYPNLGPLLLVSAGIPVVDEVGPALMSVPEGSTLHIDKGRIHRDSKKGLEVGRGSVLNLEGVEKTLDEAKQRIGTEIERFAENTIGYIKDERDVLLEVARLPEVKTDFHGRHVLVVVRGYGYKEDLAALRSYIRETRPLLVAVDGGADALLDKGLKPNMIIGDMDSVTTEALLCGAELVVHAYPGGEAPGLERLDALGIPSIVFEASGTSEDIAMLLAYEHGAELIVAVGTHANLIEFMDKGRKGMASTFLTRLRVGPVLVDAKGVGKLYRGRVRRKDLLLLLATALITMAIVIALSRPMRLQIEIWWIQLEDFWFSIKQAVFG
jgi:uncharacterized membrane-anchored protein